MKNSTKIATIIFSVFLMFYSIKSNAQYGVMKSKNGFVVFTSSDSLNFTLKLDEPNTEIPIWINENFLLLFENSFNIQIIDKKYITPNDTSLNGNLYELQKWETDYIKSEMKESVKMSAFINDNDSIKFKNNNLEYNAWYYWVELEKEKLYIYFYDFYKNGYYIRATYIGALESARLFIPVVLNDLIFYDKKIDINKLQQSLKDGQYSNFE